MAYNRTAAISAVIINGKKCGYDRDDIRDIAASLFGLDPEEARLSKLDNNQLSTLIETFKNAKPGEPIQIKNRISQRQIWKINQYADELGWTDPKRLEGFIERQTGKKNLRSLTKQDGIKVIDGLKKISERQ